MENSFEINKQKGCFQIARSLFHDEIWLMKPSWWCKVWIYIIGKANHTDYNDKIKRGDLFTTYRQIYSDCNLTLEGVRENAIDNVISYLKDTQKCTTRKTTRGFIITVLNYDLYQTISNYKNDTENEIQTIPKRNGNDMINNNDKNEKMKVAKPPNFSSISNVTDDVMAAIAVNYGVTPEYVKEEKESARLWLKAEGKTKKDYKAFLESWIRRGLKKPGNPPDTVNTEDNDKKGLGKEETMAAIKRQNEERGIYESY